MTDNSIPPFPFDEHDLYQGLALVASPDEARRLAADMAEPPVDDAIGWGISNDTLILMSLASATLAQKVERFLEMFRRSHHDDERWTTRRRELKSALISAGRLPDNAQE